MCLEAVPQRGPRAEPLVRGFGITPPPLEAESFLLHFVGRTVEMQHLDLNEMPHH